MKREDVRVGMVVYDKKTGFYVRVGYENNGSFFIQAGCDLFRSERSPKDLRPLTKRERGER